MDVLIPQLDAKRFFVPNFTFIFEMAPKGDLELNTGIQISIHKANSLDGQTRNAENSENIAHSFKLLPRMGVWK